MSERVVHFGVLFWDTLACVGMPVWEGECQGVCFSLKVFEAALLMSACQEHGKWHLEKRRKAERRKGVKEGWGGYVCERVVHAGVLFWDTLACVGIPVWEGECQGVCFSLKVFEAALLMSACQEHG
ncbi:hypothetical protein, partial [Bartonella sp. AC535YNZD]|uniref:hypothetical protein n=1 Tax=Bartonella sp. AC535YNZD TaxID=3243455 RepID=UPI0035CF2DE4